MFKDGFAQSFGMRAYLCDGNIILYLCIVAKCVRLKVKCVLKSVVMFASG